MAGHWPEASLRHHRNNRRQHRRQRSRCRPTRHRNEIRLDPAEADRNDRRSGRPRTEDVVAYDKETGLLTERRTPGGEKAGDANTTKIKYYKGGGGVGCFEGGGTVDGYSGLPCEVGPGGQPGTAGLPELLVTKYLAYNAALGQPTEVRESPGGGKSNVRKTLMTYDAVGRRLTHQQEGGGTALPKTETEYDSASGMPVEQRFVCESCDSQEVVSAYDALGRPVQYTDADGNTSKTTYDLLGRPVTINDGKGTQTFGYDATSGLLVAMEDSAAGTFTASYDADGKMVEQGLPERPGGQNDLRRGRRSDQTQLHEDQLPKNAPGSKKATNARSTARSSRRQASARASSTATTRPGG